MFLFYFTKKFQNLIDNKIIPCLFGDFEDQEGICCCDRNAVILALPLYIIISLPVLVFDFVTLPIKIPFIIYRYCRYKKCS
jgi:hypothetical protein